MLDADLIALMRAELVTQVAARYSQPLNYALMYQPQQEGRPSGSFIWYHKASGFPVGQRKTVSKWNGTEMVRTERQTMRTTIQLSASSDLDGAVTVSDVMEIVAGVMRSDRWIESMRPHGVQILSVGGVTNTPVKNDSDQWEDSPRFDVEMAHEHVFVDNQEPITKFVLETYWI